LRDTGWEKGSEKGYTRRERRRGLGYVGERRKHGHMCGRIVEDEGQREDGRRG